MRSLLLYPSKGGDTAAPSDTAPLLRLHPNHWSHLRRLAPTRVTSPTSAVTDSRGVTGGVYNAPQRIHRGILVRDYSRSQLHVGELQPTIRTENGFMGFASRRRFAARCSIQCSTCVAQVIRGMMT